jgi:hypothetical protein
MNGVLTTIGAINSRPKPGQEILHSFATKSSFSPIEKEPTTIVVEQVGNVKIDLLHPFPLDRRGYWLKVVIRSFRGAEIATRFFAIASTIPFEDLIGQDVDEG